MVFHLRTEYITLSQLLKAVDMASSGADAKAILAEGGALVNGEEDNRRGRKLRVGDVVQLSDGVVIRVK